MHPYTRSLGAIGNKCRGAAQALSSYVLYLLLPLPTYGRRRDNECAAPQRRGMLIRHNINIFII